MAVKKKAKAKAKPKAKAKAKPKGRKKPIGKAWSKDEIKMLRLLYKSKPASAIAKEMKRSLASVRGKISALGLVKPASARKAKAKPKPKPKARKKAKAKAKPKAKVKKAKAKPRKKARR